MLVIAMLVIGFLRYEQRLPNECNETIDKGEYPRCISEENSNHKSGSRLAKAD